MYTSTLSSLVFGFHLLSSLPQAFLKSPLLNLSDVAFSTMFKEMPSVQVSVAGFSSISTNHVMTECVAVLNSYHMAITTTPKKEVHNVKSYFSGHYQTYGINIEVACDHNCHFLFIGVGGPGIMGDRETVKESGLSKLVEKLPGLLYCIGDCAYTPTEHLIPIYGADNTTKSQYNNFNFYASQLRIDVIWLDGKEMGHSIMTNYYQNAKGEASNMFHSMSSQLLYQ